MLRQQCYLLCIISISYSVMAEDIQELEPVIISAPLHQKVAETAHPVNVLAGEDLSMKQATTIGETLKGELGIHSMSLGLVLVSP